MAQKKKRKAVRVLGIVLLLGLLIVAGVIFFTKQGTKEKENRTARVISTKGNVVIQRVRADDTQAYTSMELESGDIIVTGEDSGITIVLDEDKRIVLDENTKVLLQLSGTKAAGQTGLYLEYGAVLSDIEEKLTPESSYEVVTEASTMSVRGTRFEVVYREVRDAAGNVSGMETKVLTFSGAVYVEPEGVAAPRMSRTGTMEVLTETEPGKYEFYGATKIIEATDLRTYSAEYLKQELEDDYKVLSEEEREQQEYLLNEIEQYIETVMPEKSEQPDDTDKIVTPVPTGVPSLSPSPSPTSSPSPTPSPSPSPTSTPSPSPSPTSTPSPSPSPSLSPTTSPTPSPIPTRAALPTPTARPGASPVVTPTEKPDYIPSPTPVPKTSPSPTATPEIQETLTVRYFIPLVMRDLNSMVAGDVFDVMSQLSIYEIPKNGTSSETVLVHKAVSDVLMKAAASYVNNGRVQDSAVTAYGAGTTVLCDGFYDTRGNFYHTSEANSFESYGWNVGDTVELYAAYTVYSPEGTYSYVPCTLKADIKVLFISYKNNYMMGMPVGETVLLPEVDGFTLQWKSGPNQSGDSIRIDGGEINSAHLSVKMK